MGSHSRSPLYDAYDPAEDAPVRSLASRILNGEFGEAVDLYRTARALHAYSKAELVDHLLKAGRTSPDIANAAVALACKGDPTDPSHELMSESALAQLASFVRGKRQFAMAANHELFLTSARRRAPEGALTGVDLGEFGLGKLLKGAVVGVRTGQPPALRLVKYLASRTKYGMLVLAPHNPQQLDCAFYVKCAGNAVEVRPGCLVVPRAHWTRNLAALDKVLLSLWKPEHEVVVVVDPCAGPGDESAARDEQAVTAIAKLKTFCSSRGLPGVAVVCCPMVKSQERMPPVLWHSLFVDHEKGTARMHGPTRQHRNLDFWRKV